MFSVQVVGGKNWLLGSKSNNGRGRSCNLARYNAREPDQMPQYLGIASAEVGYSSTMLAGNS